MDRLPPEWTWWQRDLVILGELLVYGTGIAFAAICLSLLFENPLQLKCECWLYVLGILFLVGLYMVRLLRHPFRVHEERLVDRTEVEALFKQASPDAGKNLRKLIKCLEHEGPSTWTEYRILPVEQDALKRLSAKDLIAKAHARLDDLKEYDEKRGEEEKEYFNKREKRLHKSIKTLKETSSSDTEKVKRRKKAKKALRADLGMLLETLADYDKNWAIGSEILRALLIVISFTIPILLVLGVAPVLMPPRESLGFVNWALLGVAGSLTAVLRKLYLGSKVEVGDTEGKNELYQAIKGAVLGLVSGVLVFAMLSGSIISKGTIVPNVDSLKPNEIYLSVFWAFMAGFAFENFFDKVQREQIGKYN